MRQITTVNDSGTSITAVLRLPNEPLWSGTDNAHTRQRCAHEQNLTIVELFDASYAGPRFGPLGQLICAYTLADFVAADTGNGMLLHMAVPTWRLTPYNVRVIVEQLLGEAIDAIEIPTEG